MATIEAVARALRQGNESTRPSEDAARLAAVARRHHLPAAALEAAAVEIGDFSRRPETPLARVVFRTWGDQGSAVLRLAIELGRRGASRPA